MLGTLPNPMGLSSSPYQTATTTAATAVQQAPNAGMLGKAFSDITGSTILGTPFNVFLGLVILLFGFKFLSESDATEIDPFDLRISGYNVIAVGLSAAVFFTVIKVLFNRFKVRGLTDLVNFL